MKKNLVIALVFVVGIVCGYSFSQLIPKNDETVVKTVPEQNENNEQNEDNNGSPPELTEALEQELFQTLLPANSPLWVEFNFAQLQEKGEEIGDFLKKDSVQPIWKKLISNFPKGATQVFEVIADSNDVIRIFSSPFTDTEDAKLLIAGLPAEQNDDEDIVHDPFNALVAALPEATTHEAQAGANKFQAITTPLGELTIAQGTQLNWYATDPTALENIFNDPPDPPENKPVFQDISQEHEQAVAILVINSMGTSAIPLPFGLNNLTQQQNINQSALVLSWPEDSSSLTILAHTNDPPEWVQEWQDLNDVMFTVSDPVGIVEGAIQWPPEITDQQNEALANNRPQSGDRGNGPGNRWPRNRPGRDGSQPPRGRQQMQNQQMPAQFLSRLFPNNYPIGFNFFGFYKGKPAITFALPDLQQNNPLLNQLNRLSQDDAEQIEIANLPGKKFALTSTPMARRMQPSIDELLMIERDAVTYLFDNPESASNYLTAEESMSNRSNRNQDLRDLYEKARESSQIKILLTTDFFEYVMNQELQYWHENLKAQDELLLLFDDINPHLSAISISAGFHEEEWYLEQYSEDKLGHIIGNVLLMLGIYRSF